jgi:integrase
MPSLIRRRENKSGTVSWQIRFPYTDPETGEPRVFTETHSKKKDAVNALTDMKKEVNEGGVVEESEMLLRDFVTDWLETTKPSLRENTFESYRTNMNTWVLPRIGGLKLIAFTPSKIQRFYNELTKKGLSPRTVRYVHSTLHGALDHAVTLRLIRRNPTNGLKLPKPQQREIVAMSEEDVQAFLEEGRDDRLLPYYVAALTTGARPSELLGLRWKCVDLESGLIRIDRALVTDRNGWRLRAPKTKQGRRTIPIPPETVEALRVHKARQGEERLRAGEAWQDHGLVFTTEIGTPLSLANIRNRSFNRIVKEAGLNPKLTPYSTRHTAATLLLKRGVNPKVAAERLGHASVTITLDTYAHVLPGMQEDATEVLADAIFDRSR